MKEKRVERVRMCVCGVSTKSVRTVKKITPFPRAIVLCRHAESVRCFTKLKKENVFTAYRRVRNEKKKFFLPSPPDQSIESHPPASLPRQFPTRTFGARAFVFPGRSTAMSSVQSFDELFAKHDFILTRSPGPGRREANVQRQMAVFEFRFAATAQLSRQIVSLFLCRHRLFPDVGCSATRQLNACAI